MTAERFDSRPLADALEEAVALVRSAAAEGVVLRLTGGIAIRLVCPTSSRPVTHKDIDVVGRGRQRREVEEILCRRGYEPDRQFNLLHGRTRLAYSDLANARELDVFFDRLDMCHALDLGDRLDLDELTLSPPDLLLTKLQIVQASERDFEDVVELLGVDIDWSHVARVLAGDWGWWRTVTQNLEKIGTYIASRDQASSTQAQLHLSALRAEIDAEPKSRRWKLRARVGERMVWYALPEETG